MMKIDRTSEQDAKNIFEKLLPNLEIRLKVAAFLGTAIGFADVLNSSQWNLNLDTEGKFIRFNVGHSFCIEVRSQEVLILCDRVSIRPLVLGKFLPITFIGYEGRIIKESRDIDKTPNCLAKVENSIGCLLKEEGIKNHIDLFTQANFDFIKLAIKMPIANNMREAHSTGAIAYLSSLLGKSIDNPIYAKTDLPILVDILEQEKSKITQAKKLSREKRQAILANSAVKPTRTTVTQIIFNRNQYVVAEVLDNANGICQKCHKPAPFIKDSDKQPYLEVHHIIPLAENGDDTVANAIALCPNCHRQAHYGKLSY